MATLQNIRNRAGVLVAIVIGISLIAFILGDFLNSGQVFFSGQQNEIAEIDGKSISYNYFQAKVDELTENYKRNSNSESTPDEATMENLRKQAWDDIVLEYVMQGEYDALGLDVTSEELFDMVQGNNIDPQIQQAPLFTNQTTGRFDKTLVIQFLKNMETRDSSGVAKASWLTFEQSLLIKRKVTKFNNLIKKGLYITTVQVKKATDESNYNVNFKYINLPYTTVPDANITVSNAEIEEYYNTHQKNYKQDASRDIEYITFDVVPSKEDIQLIEEWAKNTKVEFEKTENSAQFVNLNSDSPYDSKHYKKGELSKNIDSLMFNSDTLTVYGPFIEKDEYQLVRLVSIKPLPDSVKSSHILIQPNDKITKDKAKFIADSLKNVLVKNKGANFAELAMKYSVDQGSAKTGGDLGWFKEKMMIAPIEKACFEGKKGDIVVVETQYGYHVVQITDQSEALKKVQVAIVSRKVVPSTKTYQHIFATASQFGGLYNTKDKFTKAIISKGLNKKIGTQIKESDKNISGMSNAREVVRWVYQAKTGDVSGVIELDDRFVIALLTIAREKGIAPLEQVKSEIEVIVKKNKKASQFIAKINDAMKTTKNIDDLSLKLKLQVQKTSGVNFLSFSIPGLGIEPNITATATTISPFSLSKPIQGNAGVFVLYVDSVDKAPKIDFINEYRTLAYEMQGKVDYFAYEALKEIANITDKRGKFF